MLGTEWVAPNAGSTVQALYDAFAQTREFERRFLVRCMNYPGKERTNLWLTGAPICDYDWQRLESAAFQVGSAAPSEA